MKYNITLLLCLLFITFKPIGNKLMSKQEFYGQFLNQKEIVKIISQVNQNYNYDIEILIALCWRESGFKSEAKNININGSQDNGLMQINSNYFNGEYVNNSLVNITLGVVHFDNAMKKGIYIERGLSIYNTGKIKKDKKINQYISDILLYAINLKEEYNFYIKENTIGVK